MASERIAAAAAGAWTLGDLQVNRLGFGAMRLTGNGMRGNSDGPPIDRGVAIGLLRRAVELGVNHVDTTPPGHRRGPYSSPSEWHAAR